METDVARSRRRCSAIAEHAPGDTADAKNPDGSLKRFLSALLILPSDRFEIEIVNSADPYGAVPLARSRSRAHAVARPQSDRAGASSKVDFVLMRPTR